MFPAGDADALALALIVGVGAGVTSALYRDTILDRLLTGGIWAQIDMRFEYDEESKGKNPFWIDKLAPIQLATFDLEEYRKLR